MKNLMEGYVGIIAGDTTIDGQLDFSKTVMVNGRFKGEISNGGTLIIGEDGKLDSDIHVSDIIIHGEVHGTINASGIVDIRKSGTVFCDIKAQTILVESGAIVKGNVRSHQKITVETEIAENSSSERIRKKGKRN